MDNFNKDVFEDFQKNAFSEDELSEIKGGSDGAGWVTSISGECTRSGESCWTMQGLGDWISGN